VPILLVFAVAAGRNPQIGMWQIGLVVAVLQQRGTVGVAEQDDPGYTLAECVRRQMRTPATRAKARRRAA
jgi:hypothetical protein